MTFKVRRLGYVHPDAVALTELAQAFYVELYGTPDEAPHTPDEFVPPNGAFLVGYLDGHPVAMGGWRMIGDRVEGAERPAEVKRMYVRDDLRRRGYARLILSALETSARASGVDMIVLETGAPQEAAVALYAASGYTPISGFGFYAGWPNARAFAKRLPALPSLAASQGSLDPSKLHDTGASSRTRRLAGMAESKKVAFLVASEGIEKAELAEPWAAVEQGGHQPVLLSPESGSVQLFEHLDKANTQPVDVTVSEASIDDYAALVLPGGVANPDALRTNQAAVAFVKEFVESGKPVAAICHAPWTLVEADVLRGRQLTSWPSLQTDIRNAGGKWVDEEVVVDGNLITSRNPGDIPAFNNALLEAVNHGAASAGAAVGR